MRSAQVELPNGRVTGRDLVRHPGAAAVVALTETGKIVLVRQYRTAIDRVTVEIPAGKLDPGEDPLDCAKRELLEETGFSAGRIQYLTTIATTPGFCDEVIHIYMATGLTFSGANPDDDEFVETGFSAGRIQYLTTIATTPGFCDEVIHIYMATGLTFSGANPDDDEFVNVDLVPLAELIDAVLDGKIEDAKTVVGALACDAISHRL